MQIIIFLHVLSAIVWVGGMIAIRVAVHPTMQSIEEPKIKLGKTLIIMGKLFHLVLPFIVLLLITAIMMVLQFHFEGKFASLAYTKEIIWSVMGVNFGIMYLKRYKAEKLFNLGKLAEAKQQLPIKY